MEPIHLNSLTEETRFILEESRIVVPGVQALFGFQWIAVFNEAFSKKLSVTEQKVHLAAIIFVAFAMVLVMTPAALHRVGEHGKLTERFVKISSKLLKWAMFVLPLGVSIDFYLINRMITDSEAFSFAASAVLLIFCFTFWYAFPRYVHNSHQRR